MPSHPLENPFDPLRERISDKKAFVKKVLSKISASGSTSIQEEDFGPEATNLVSPEDQKRIEDEKIFGEIIFCETQALRKFFGREIPVPHLPKEATRERILEWRRMGFELHYLPNLSVAEIKRDREGKILEVTPIDFPGWKKKPGRRYTRGVYINSVEFFDEVKTGGFLDLSALDLFGGWILIDTRKKPNFDKGKQMYENDPLGPALEELRKKNVIEDFKIKGSRFNLSSNELENPKVLEAFAKVLNFHSIPGLEVSIPRTIEFNILGNIFYPEWGKTDTQEWFGDYGKGSNRLFGGDSNDGGLSCVDDGVCRGRSDGVGFRVIGRFS
ncbi:MAG TPA: hypothetical protein VFQ60_01990 [Patescibacteria group bacterium]|nr:hypothetical protein [Patescibacteria group bacterium]